MKLPLLYACAGCSSAGRLAYDVAQELDRRGVAEMSCLAGIGAAIPHFLKMTEGREVWVIDGCPLHCGLGIFRQVEQSTDVHIRLYELGIRKNDPVPTEPMFQQVVTRVIQKLPEQQSESCTKVP